MIEFKLNGQPVSLDLDPEMPLLWALRDHLHLTGTKYGCGKGYCGACTVHVDGQATRSCVLTLGAAQGLEVRTIEAFGAEASHPVQIAWAEVNVAQCGYCQTGQVMSAIALLEQNPQPSDAEIAVAMNGNLCRCGTYPRIRQAIRQAAEST
jgi:isoquinoline 1-oxidoreductase subunit alpha